MKRIHSCLWFASTLLLVAFAAVHNAEALTKGQAAEPAAHAGDDRQRQLKMMKMKYRNYYYRDDNYYYGKSGSKCK
jgi:hypothetical protein